MERGLGLMELLMSEVQIRHAVRLQKAAEKKDQAHLPRCLIPETALIAGPSGGLVSDPLYIDHPKERFKDLGIGGLELKEGDTSRVGSPSDCPLSPLRWTTLWVPVPCLWP